MFLSKWEGERGIGIDAKFTLKKDNDFKRNAWIATNVEPDSAAFRAGIQVGFEIYSFDMSPFGDSMEVKWGEESLAQIDQCVPKSLTGIRVRVPPKLTLDDRANGRRFFIRKKKVDMLCIFLMLDRISNSF